MIGHRGLGGPCSSDPWARGFGDMPIPPAVAAVRSVGQNRSDPVPGLCELAQRWTLGTARIPPSHWENARNLLVQARACNGYRAMGAKSMRYQLPGSQPTMTDLVAAWVMICVLFGGLFLASFV